MNEKRKFANSLLISTIHQFSQASNHRNEMHTKHENNSKLKLKTKQNFYVDPFDFRIIRCSNGSQSYQSLVFIRHSEERKKYFSFLVVNLSSLPSFVRFIWHFPIAYLKHANRTWSEKLWKRRKRIIIVSTLVRACACVWNNLRTISNWQQINRFLNDSQSFSFFIYLIDSA